MSVILQSSGGGQITLQEPATASNFTQTLPAADGTAILANGSGDLQMNSGYGSNATAYGCRAWVNFNGTGTVAIRGSGNVSSITDNGTGDYTINFSTTMPDTNYSIHGTTNNSVSTSGAAGFQGVMQDSANAPSTSAVRIKTIRSTVAFSDFSLVSVSIHR